MTNAEKEMRATIELLFTLPAGCEERQRMEAAANCTFSPEDPAPIWNPLEESKHCAKQRSVVWRIDLGTVEAAELLCSRGFRPAVLNFAHGYNCGGGFEHTDGSQEEDIFRKTSLFLSLWPHRRTDDGAGVLRRGMWIGDFDDALPRKEAFYPHTDCGGIYSPHVRVVRQLAERDAPLVPREDIEFTVTFGVLTIAAQNVGLTGYFDDELLRQKVRTAMHLALSHGHDSAVFGAFGCGYFCNPSAVVAQVFQELLEGEFANAFNLVLFAIPGGKEGFDDRFELVNPRKVPAKEDAKDKHRDKSKRKNGSRSL